MEENSKNYETMLKKYQDNPDTLLKNYDNMIFELIVGILTDYYHHDIVRDDVVSGVYNLINIRPFIVNYNRNNSSS